MKTVIEFPVKEVISLIKESPETSSIYVGCDSLQKKDFTDFITVVVIHYGSNNGGTFRHTKVRENRRLSIRERLWKEVELVSAIALEIADHIGKRRFEVHLDLSQDSVNKSNVILKEAAGYISALGFDVAVKPNAFAASAVADRVVRK